MAESELAQNSNVYETQSALIQPGPQVPPEPAGPGEARPSKQYTYECRDFARGICTRPNCKFNHTPRLESGPPPATSPSQGPMAQPGRGLHLPSMNKPPPPLPTTFSRNPYSKDWAGGQAPPPPPPPTQPPPPIRPPPPSQPPPPQPQPPPHPPPPPAEPLLSPHRQQPAADPSFAAYLPNTYSYETKKQKTYFEPQIQSQPISRPEPIHCEKCEHYKQQNAALQKKLSELEVVNEKAGYVQGFYTEQINELTQYLKSVTIVTQEDTSSQYQQPANASQVTSAYTHVMNGQLQQQQYVQNPYNVSQGQTMLSSQPVMSYQTVRHQQ